MHHLKYAEFYVTNVCNLNCTNCNRFNNFAFRGHESWGQHLELYQAWAKRITFDHISILGGEPFTNPDILKWIEGILALWPNTTLSVVTNGTQFARWPGLRDILHQYRDRLWLEVCMHGPTLRNRVRDSIQSLMMGPVDRWFDSQQFSDHNWQAAWNVIRDPAWPDCATANDFRLLPRAIQQECLDQHDLGPHWWQDSTGVRMLVTMTDQFFTSAVQHDSSSGTIKLHNSDPQRAVDICISKFCHHFSHGKLYKCGVAALLPEFVQQFRVEITEQERKLIHSYQAAEATWEDSRLDDFLGHLRRGTAIPQCQFCPQKYETVRFDSTNKKIKLIPA